MMIRWWSKHVEVFLSVLMYDILNWCFVIYKCIFWTIILSEFKCTVKQWNVSTLFEIPAHIRTTAAMTFQSLASRRPQVLTVKKEVVYFSNMLLNICHNIRCRIPRILEYSRLQHILNRHSRTESAKIGCPWHKTQHINSKQIPVMDDITLTFVSVTYQFQLMQENYLLHVSRCLIRTVKSFKRSLKS
jgi:hypothetical protein